MLEEVEEELEEDAEWEGGGGGPGGLSTLKTRSPRPCVCAAGTWLVRHAGFRETQKILREAHIYLGFLSWLR